ncbi:hypothetical protein WOLCODRAFT_144865 [Wolfiporia cocos MD-104 SS10]|uniref:F-box domain-containing protein n=1 Tax=Wolfiporia cocos (strain MD-104) TaxID=742152 RepID=A0A2H3K568_WOLCO|nr:hypothetical protein WOLCODRAFT_144865 [Wolfiporia cocos MD-104 SS10]
MTSIAPIFRLNDDCLHEVLLDVSLASPAYSREALLEKTTFLSVTHVCAYWRKFALASPILWSFIEFSWSIGHILLARILSRSCGAPLHIDYKGAGLERAHTHSVFNYNILRGFRFRYDLTAQLLAATSARIATLVLRNLNEDEWHIFRKRLQISPTPQLRCIRLESADGSLRGFNTRLISCPDDSLREICIDGLNLEFPQCINLTQLVLSRITPPTLDLLSRIIRSNLSLEILHIGLVHSYRIDHGQPSETNRSPIHLSRLRSLNIKSQSYADHVYLLSTITFPSDARIGLSFDQPYWPFGEQIDIATCCSSMMDILSAIEDLSVTISRDNTGEWTRCTYLIEHVAESRSFIAKWSLNSSYGDLQRHMSIFSFPALHRLRLHSRSALLPEEGWSSLPIFPDITELELDVQPDMLASVLHMLQRRTDSHPHAPDYVWPRLERLTIIPQPLIDKVVTYYIAQARHTILLPTPTVEIHCQVEAVPEGTSTASDSNARASAGGGDTI